MDRTDEQWSLVSPLLPACPKRRDGRGRPWRCNRAVLNGILWILRTGVPWHDLLDRYPSYQTPFSRPTLAHDLHEHGGLDRSECFIDSLFVATKKGGPSGSDQAGQSLPRRKRGYEAHAVADRAGIPIAVPIQSASPHEVTLVEATLENRWVQPRPQRLIGDRAYDSDRLDARLANQGIEMIAPHRRNRTQAKTQDGRRLRGYKRRWKIERLFAWLQNFRRIGVRYEYYAENDLGLVQLGCILILLRYL